MAKKNVASSNKMNKKLFDKNGKMTIQQDDVMKELYKQYESKQIFEDRLSQKDDNVSAYLLQSVLVNCKTQCINAQNIMYQADTEFVKTAATVFFGNTFYMWYDPAKKTVTFKRDKYSDVAIESFKQFIVYLFNKYGYYINLKYKTL